MNKKRRFLFSRLGTVLLFSFIFLSAICRAEGDPLRFEISFPKSVYDQPITGRVFVMVSNSRDPEPRLQVGFWFDETPLFGADVEGLEPGEVAVIDSRTLGFPLTSLGEIPAGEYYVQGLVNIYTRFERSDGHVIWAHMDHWEGQQFNKSPGNLCSEIQKVRLDPDAGYTVQLNLSKEIPPIDLPPDTEWVKHEKFESKLLSEFWGHPIYVGATVLLPRGYEEHHDVYYPVNYAHGHFSLSNPYSFSTVETPETEEEQQKRMAREVETGYEFYQSWISDHFPRMIVVTFQHPTPYFDDSYGVNSVNTGPYGDAFIKELIPFVEQKYRIIRKAYARTLSGGSTGGWIALAQQVYYPDFFGGTWTFFPDSTDFRRYGLVNIYEDGNAFCVPGYEWFKVERSFERRSSGQSVVTERQLSQLEAVLGSEGRSGQQLEIWEAVYGPIGEGGYPKPLWNKLTGEIDLEVANYMKVHGYDLRHYMETRWPQIGPKLLGKLKVFCGDMDDYYLNESTYLLEEFLESTDPYYGGSFTYGRPQKGHGWFGMTRAELLESMAEHIAANAPEGTDGGAWKY